MPYIFRTIEATKGLQKLETPNTYSNLSRTYNNVMILFSIYAHIDIVLMTNEKLSLYYIDILDCLIHIIQRLIKRCTKMIVISLFRNFGGVSAKNVLR